MTQTIFEQIRERIAHNEVNNNGRHFFIYQTTPQYPSGILKFLVNNNILEIKDIEKSYNNGFEFKVTYKNLDENNKFISKAIRTLEYEQYKREKRDKNKAIKNMTYREEFECPNFSNIEDETGFISCPHNTGGYEKIEPSDSCMTDLVLQQLGYNSYDEFTEAHKDIPSDEIKEVMYEELREFEKNFLAQPWEQGYEEEE